VGVGTVFAGPSTGLAQPVGLAFDSKGNLFVANEQNNTILTIIRELRELTPITSSSSRAALLLVLGLTC
jgi:DNA-binding beta-propeller fold protein YncE